MPHVLSPASDNRIHLRTALGADFDHRTIQTVQTIWTLFWVSSG
jgi:hypothetical protein